eukprot:1923060-Pyramimonas_sp.AAC.1
MISRAVHALGHISLGLHCRLTPAPPGQPQPKRFVKVLAAEGRNKSKVPAHKYAYCRSHNHCDLHAHIRHVRAHTYTVLHDVGLPGNLFILDLKKPVN